VEKEKLRKTVVDLSTKFPGLISQIDQLTGGYRSLEEAVRNATAAKIAFTERQNVEKELETIRSTIRDIQGGWTFNRDASGRKILSKEEAAQMKALLAQEKDAQQRLETLPEIIKAKLKALNEEQKKSALPNSPSLNIPTQAELDKIKNAQEQFTKLTESLEVELTGFLQGEFAKRRQDAERDYRDNIRRIQDLSKTAKTSQKEITQALGDADRLRKERIAEIARQETQAIQDAKLAIKDIQTNIQSLNAAITLGNPFDDITADAEKARVEITKNYALAVRTLDEQVRKNPQLGNIATQTKGLLKQQYDAALQQQSIFTKQRQFEEGRALADSIKQNELAQAEISGNTLKIEQATNQKTIADLENRIANQKKILQENLLPALKLAPNSQDAQLGVAKAQTELDNLQLERKKAIQQGALREADIQSGSLQRIVDLLQNEINLYGKRPELVKKLIEAYNEYLSQLEKEKNLTGQTSEKQAEITQNIQGAKHTQTQLRVESTLFGRVLTKLQGITPPTGAFGDFFQTVVSGCHP
jgi:hypothetical protein